MTKTKTQKARAAAARGVINRKPVLTREQQSAHDKRVHALYLASLGGGVAPKKRSAKAQGFVSDVVIPAAKNLAKQAAAQIAKKAAVASANALMKGAEHVAGKLRKYATSEEQYLYGFVDPENASPGPGDAQYSTYVVKHRNYKDFTVSDHASGAVSGLNYKMLNNATWKLQDDGYLDGADNTGVYTDDNAYRVTNSDPITFVACPHYVRAMAGATPSGLPDETTIGTFISRASMGFQCSNVTFGQAAYSNTYFEADGSSAVNSAGSWMKPMKNFDIDIFTNKSTSVTTQKAPNATEITDRVATHCVRHRLVGLKLTVLCNSPALTVTGQVVGGDNRHLFGAQPEYIRRENIAGAFASAVNPNVVDTVADYGVDPSENLFTGKTFAQSRRDLGALTHGMRYEATFIPASDHILQWSTIPAAKGCVNSPTEKADTAVTGKIIGGWQLDSAHYSYMRMVDMAMNIPMCYITVTGCPAGTTFRAFVSAAIEYVVLNDSPLALVREAARMTKRFMPDWGELAVIPSACCGSCEIAKKAVKTCSCVRHGMAAAVGILPKEVGRKVDSEMYSIGAGNAASQLASKTDVRNTLNKTEGAATATPATNTGAQAAAPGVATTDKPK